MHRHIVDSVLLLLLIVYIPVYLTYNPVAYDTRLLGMIVWIFSEVIAQSDHLKVKSTGMSYTFICARISVLSHTNHMTAHTCNKSLSHTNHMTAHTCNNIKVKSSQNMQLQAK